MGGDWYDICSYSFRGIFIPRELFLNEYKCPPGLNIGYLDKNGYATHAFVYITHSMCLSKLSIPGPYEIVQYPVKVSRMTPMDTRLMNEDISILTEAYKDITGQTAEPGLVGFWNILSTYRLDTEASDLNVFEKSLTFAEFQRHLGYEPGEIELLEHDFSLEWNLKN